MRLAGKIALVTGGGSGFGAEICRTFAREGATVAVLDVNEQNGRAVASEIKARFIRCDVAKRADVAGAVAEMHNACGRVDVYVNNAGITHTNAPLLEVEDSWFDRIFAVNVKAIYFSALELVPVFRAQGGGAIINVASTAGVRPRPGLVVYNASKGAVHLMTKSMAVELAPDKIRVCALAPVAGETPLLAMFLGEDTPERRAAFKATVPLGRFSTPQDVGAAALFLASDEAAFLTGVVLEVDGGRCI